MQALTDEGAMLVDRLWQTRRALWRRTRRALDALDAIEARREPAAFPNVVAFLPHASPEVGARAARVVRSLLDATGNLELAWLDRHVRGSWRYFPWSELGPDGVGRFPRLGDHASAVWAALCSSPNGRVRELALRRLGGETTGFEVRFLLPAGARRRTRPPRGALRPRRNRRALRRRPVGVRAR